MRSVFFFLWIVMASVANAADSREKLEDLRERRLIIEEAANLLSDEQMQSGEFSRLMVKLDAIDAEIETISASSWPQGDDLLIKSVTFCDTVDYEKTILFRSAFRRGCDDGHTD